MSYEELIQSICDHALKILGQGTLRFRPMRRKTRVDPKRGFVIGRTNLKTGLITIDILTPAKREPKKIASVLRTLCHEVAHHQKPPYRQFYRWRWIMRQHYPKFYKQILKNIEKLKKDEILKNYFN
ncbi:hypothetical protein A2227_05150 [Candidatus Falkowbacteria bacterium RIFOXYA2_FULL_47_19]|uniref:SprT-like domain-containing protein n=1 Tax=Candidatus Falkowbacteria bacterium RIFOXYA2_FULL_47_19 TaxID=1797994 RepID=A0A1F5SMQ6_9BACT|nr:MAG: hypothetical protein A2227_05150 [Candidatus Falkowbacteria bacterium RIFOXYA2_FULL_47_19]